MENILACTTNTYHNVSPEDGLRGISEAKFRYVELAAVPGVTQHVYPEKSLKSLKEKLAKNGLYVCADALLCSDRFSYGTDSCLFNLLGVNKQGG
ncbi:hypothetical protein CEE35_09575 [Candidatus Aerophobetes bacterium Ae_b3b]|nr:MAG: hypothetical protein CEE35_09575 [Candidatus Aerophobetes bacterium Ae_b3b]